MYKLQDVGLRILSPKNLDLIGNVLIALLETCRAIGVNPEHSRPQRLLVNSIIVLDGELRLASRQLAICIDRSIHAYLTSPRSTSAVQEPNIAHF
jgi:hypothetical protein